MRAGTGTWRSLSTPQRWSTARFLVEQEGTESSFQTMAEVIEGWPHLDGATPTRARAERIAAFEPGPGDVFLISLKAGGVGLDLPAADYVIHIDSWWNPRALSCQLNALRLALRPMGIVLTRERSARRRIRNHARARRVPESCVERVDGSRRNRRNPPPGLSHEPLRDFGRRQCLSPTGRHAVWTRVIVPAPFVDPVARPAPTRRANVRSPREFLPTF